MYQRIRFVSAALVACAIGLGASLHGGASMHMSPLPGLTVAYAQNEIGFNEAKEKGTKTSFEKFDIYTLITQQDGLTKNNQVVLYGEFKMPYNYSDIEIDNHENNYVKINQYMNGFFELDPEHLPNSKYDATIFKVNIQPFAVNQEVKTLTITVDGEPYEVNLPSSMSTLYTKDLSDALQEHGSEYRNAIAFGMEVTPESERAFLDISDEANKLLDKAKKPNTNVTQQDIDQMRTRYNEAFSRLQPKPFEREALKESYERAKSADALQGVNNKRYEKDGYDNFSKLMFRAGELLEHEDLSSIVGPREADAAPTHREYRELPKKLDEARNALKLVDYTPVDMTSLRELYNKAVQTKPHDGKTYTAASFDELYTALQEAGYTMIDPYATEESVRSAHDRLKRALDTLVEEDLDAATAFDMSIRYRHPLDDAPSAKIDDYFRKEDGPIVEVLPGVRAGEIIRIYLDDTKLIKVFEGYRATSFFYASRDTSQDTVRVLRDENGKQFIVFRAEKNGDLDIKYLKHIEASDPDSSTEVDEPNSTEKKPVDEHAEPVTQTKTVRYKKKHLPNTGVEQSASLATAVTGFASVVSGFAVRKALRRK